MKILAIGAHPDDIEIFMFGLLKLFKNRGDSVYLAIATDGALGGEKDKNKLIQKRMLETKKGLIELGVPYSFSFPDGSLGSDILHLKTIKEYIFSIKPDLIITHHKKDYHSDHRALAQIVTTVSSHYIPVLFCETMMGLNFRPTYFIDITKVFAMKRKAVLSHISQKPKRFVKLIELMNSYRSAQCNSPEGTFAECYYFSRSFPFSDIANLLPPSPILKPFDIKNQVGFL